MGPRTAECAVSLSRLLTESLDADFVGALLVPLVVFFGRCECRFFDTASRHARQVPKLAFDFASQGLISQQKVADRITALPETFAVVGIPSAGLFQHFPIHAEIHQLTGF